MYDSRFPHMIPLFDHRPVPGLDVFQQHKVRDFATRVARRTGTVPFYNLLTNAIFLSLTTTPEIGPPAIPASMWSQQGDTSHVVDECVSFVNRGKMSKERKDQIAKSNAQKEQWHKQDKMRELFEERRPDALDYADYLDKKRRGVVNTTVTL